MYGKKVSSYLLIFQIAFQSVTFSARAEITNPRLIQDYAYLLNEIRKVDSDFLGDKTIEDLKFSFKQEGKENEVSQAILQELISLSQGTALAEGQCKALRECSGRMWEVKERDKDIAACIGVLSFLLSIPAAVATGVLTF